MTLRWCALLLFAPLAASATAGSLKAARLVPAGADAALLLDSADALSGPRAFLEAAGKLAPMIGPGEVSRLLERSVAVDVLAAQPARSGLKPSGPRALALWGRALGASFPVANAAQARAALDQWLAEVGPPKATPPLKVAGSGKRTRAGAVVRVAGADRLVVASGHEAQRLAAGLASVGRKRRALSANADIARELKKAAGPAVLYLRGEAPVRAAVLSLTGASDHLAAEGIVLPLSDKPLLAGPPPDATACDRAPLICARAGLGAGGKELVAIVAEQWARLSLPKAKASLVARLAARMGESLTGPVALRVPQPDLDSVSADPLWALGFTLAGLQRGFNLEALSPLPRGAVSNAKGVTIDAPRTICLRADADRISLGDTCDEPAPALATASGREDSVAALDTPGLARTLSHSSALSAFRGPLHAAAYTARLLFGKLLAGSDPLTARAWPAPGKPAAARVELRWPLK